MGNINKGCINVQTLFTTLYKYDLSETNGCDCDCFVLAAMCDIFLVAVTTSPSPDTRVSGVMNIEVKSYHAHGHWNVGTEIQICNILKFINTLIIQRCFDNLVVYVITTIN